MFLQHQAQTTGFPLMLEVTRASGCYLYDANEKVYLDLISGIAVSSLGHGNPSVREAVKHQVDRHMHLMVYGEFIQSPQVEYAKMLTSQLPEKLDCVYFVNSGTEAVEGALKLAKRLTGKTRVVAARRAYHGSTHGSLSLNSEEYFKQAFRPLLPDIHFIEFNDFSDIEQINTDTACVILETVRGESGYETSLPEYLQRVRKKCDETGALLILDEIQCGMGRTGTLWAFSQYGLEPDILLLGKALGGGMPLGAFISSRERMSSLMDDPILGHITTFGGHPVSCAAGSASFKILLQEPYIQQIAEKERRFRERLVHPLIQGISGKGMMLAVDFGTFETSKAIIDGCLNDGLITDWFLFAPHKLRIAPPLIMTNEEIDQACDIILKNCTKFD